MERDGSSLDVRQSTLDLNEFVFRRYDFGEPGDASWRAAGEDEVSNRFIPFSGAFQDVFLRLQEMLRGRSMQDRVFNFLFGLLVYYNLSIGSTDAAEREAFLYQGVDIEGALIHDYANRWVEVVGGSEKYLFEEVTRTEDTIELLDRSRDIGLKLHEEQGELRLRNSTEWQPWQAGKWAARSAMPKSTSFVPTDQKVRLIYFVPSDRAPIADYERRIRVVMQVVSETFSADLKAKNYHSNGFQIESNDAKVPIVHLVRPAKTAQYYNGGPAYDQIQHFQKIRDDIPASVASANRHMVVLFAETYDPGPAPIEWNGSVGRGAHQTADGGLAIMSSWILRDEFCAKTTEAQRKLFFDQTPVKGRIAMDRRKPNSARFEFVEDGFGAVIHELGHAFGLPHDYRQPNDIMGHGFRSLQVNYLPASSGKRRIVFSRENARLLGASRYLMSDLDLNDNTQPEAKVTVELRNGESPFLNVTMVATDDRKLRAVVFHDVQNDTVVGGAELNGKSQTLKLKLPLSVLTPGAFTLNTMVADDGGNISTVVSTVEVRP